MIATVFRTKKIEGFPRQVVLFLVQLIPRRRSGILVLNSRCVGPDMESVHRYYMQVCHGPKCLTFVFRFSDKMKTCGSFRVADMRNSIEITLKKMAEWAPNTDEEYRREQLFIYPQLLKRVPEFYVVRGSTA